jgi:hypothetical protein
MKDETNMADLPPYRTPRWVKVFGIIVVVLVLLVVIHVVTGIGGDHGPGRHMSMGGQTPTSNVTGTSVQQP